MELFANNFKNRNKYHIIIYSDFVTSSFLNFKTKIIPSTYVLLIKNSIISVTYSTKAM